MFTLNVLSLRNVVKLISMMQIPSMLECPNLNEVAVEILPILRLPIGIAEAPRLKILIFQDCFQLQAIDVAANPI